MLRLYSEMGSLSIVVMYIFADKYLQGVLQPSWILFPTFYIFFCHLAARQQHGSNCFFFKLDCSSHISAGKSTSCFWDTWMFLKIISACFVVSCNLTKVSHKTVILFFNDTYKLPCLSSLYFKFLPFLFYFKFLIKQPISNNGPLKHSASDFTQLQSGIVRDFECCWLTVQSAFFSIKCLRTSDRAQKRGNRDEWNWFNSITLRGRINTNIFLAEMR